jgi:hypothetical protein
MTRDFHTGPEPDLFAFGLLRNDSWSGYGEDLLHGSGLCPELGNLLP